ncbi:MAG: helix-turn-helix domain-containing protein [Actinobacteria bacterium]|nr:helix-turn-helix domain-containing protein [Actinomycetota bacterium]
MGVIGDTLSEARTRRAVDLEKVHAATGIRPRYLEAIEQEDWDALPEEFYARAFIRKYAQFLGVDPDPLVDEYKRQTGSGPSGTGGPTSPFARTGSRRAEALRRRRKRQGVYTWVGAVVLLAAIVVAVVLLSSGSDEGGGAKQSKGATGNSPNASQKKKGQKGNPPAQHQSKAKPKTVKLEIEPTAEVWTCVVDAKGKALVDGATLAAGESVGPFTSRSFTAAFGNGAVHVLVDGKRLKTPETSSPMGLSVDTQGKVHELPEGKRPTCE